jgi:hypothetical protein
MSQPIEEMLKSFLNPDFVGENKETRGKNMENKESRDVLQDKTTEKTADEVKKDTKTGKFSKVTNSKSAQTQYSIKDFNKDRNLRDSTSKTTKVDLKNSTLKVNDNDKKSAGNKIKSSPLNASTKSTEGKVPVTKELKEIKTKVRTTSKSTALKDEKPTQKKLVTALKDDFKKKDPITNGTRKETPKIIPNPLKIQQVFKKNTEQDKSKIPINDQKKVQSSYKNGSKTTDKDSEKIQSSLKSGQNKTNERTEKISSKLLNKPLQKSQNYSTTPE